MSSDYTHDMADDAPVYTIPDEYEEKQQSRVNKLWVTLGRITAAATSCVSDPAEQELVGANLASLAHLIGVQYGWMDDERKELAQRAYRDGILDGQRKVWKEMGLEDLPPVMKPSDIAH